MRAAKRSPTCIRTGGYYGRVNAGTNGTMRVTIVARTVPEDTIGVGQILFTFYIVDRKPCSGCVY